MPLWRPLARGLRALTRRTAADQDIADEVQHYVDEAAAHLEAGGVPPEEARRLARRDFGSVAGARERIRSAGWEHAVETIVADLGHAVRRLMRGPLSAAACVLTLAIGIGASTAIFSAVNPVLFRPLPYDGAERLMMVWDAGGGGRLEVTFGTFREILARSRSFDALAVARPLQVTLTGGAEPERIDGQYVSADYFRVLGVQPALGRDIAPSDDLPGRPLVALISDRLWKRRFNADPAIAGRQVVIQDVDVTVIGVLPDDFENVLRPSADIWSQLADDPALPLEGREWGRNLQMVGRARAGLSPADVDDELDAIARTGLPEFPRASWASLDKGLVVTTLQDDLTRSVRPVLLAVLGAAGLLLAIACVNVTNLLLARSAERRAELAMRTALGASRGRLARQLLVETLVLAALGGALGVAAAYAAVDGIVALAPVEVPRAGAIGVDRAALGFALALTAIVGLVIGLLPAFQGYRADVHGSLQRRSARVAGWHSLTRRALVVVQVAIALVLLAGAGLLVRSLQHLLAVPVGFEPSHVLTMQVQTAGVRFMDGAVAHRFFDEAIEAVRRIPGVSAAAYTSQLPLTGDEDVWGVHFESVPRAAADENRDGYRYAVSPGYLEAMGIPIRRGRSLTERETADAPLAAVINESFARRRLPGLDPIGQRLRVGPNSGPWFTVVGVAGDVKQASLASLRSDAVYMTAAQWPRFTDGVRWLVVRAHGDAAAVTPAVRRAIRAVDPDQVIVRVATMDERVSASAIERRFARLLLAVFGVTALVLSAIGTYGLLAGHVTERTREIGVRAALGASRAGLLTLVLRRGMALAGLGIVLGLTGALLTTRALVTLLFGVSPFDPVTYGATVALVSAVSLVACSIPAWRAARVSPSVALRTE